MAYATVPILLQQGTATSCPQQLRQHPWDRGAHGQGVQDASSILSYSLTLGTLQQVIRKCPLSLMHR